ncbi:MAG: hypothetical protein ABSD58_19595 [Verrucomicrobiia bacterium]
MKITCQAFRRGSHSFRLLSSLAVLLAVALPRGAAAQDAANPAPPVSSPDEDYFGNWFARVTKIQSEQPHWITPLTTVTPRLEEEVRYDQSWETTDSGYHLTSYGGGKGLELIPIQNVEVILGIPAYQTRNTPGTDGFADDSFLLKYRLASANEENGNYIVTAFLGLQAPTGSEQNTKHHYMVTPTIAFGKGWGHFDVQSTFGVTVPDDGTATAGPGTPLVLNTAFQYRIVKVLWPEFEVNYTYWPDGEHDGKNQVFLTPGFIIGRLPIWERLGLTIGLGYQVAVTSNPTYNHNVVLSARLPF